MNIKQKLEAKLAPVKLIETDFSGHGSEGLSQIRLRLPLKSDKTNDEQFRSHFIASMLGLHIRRFLFRSSSLPASPFGYTGFTEYALYPFARFTESGEQINAYDSIDAIKDREKNGDFTILREEYKSAPIEAKIYVRTDSVVCEYQCTDEQCKDENEVLRDEVKIIAKVTVPDKSVHVNFILRNFSIKHG